MKLFIISLCLLPFSIHAQEYLNNDGSSAPESLDRAIERHQEDELQKEEEGISEFDAQEAKKEIIPPGNAQSIQKEEEERIDDNYLIGPYNSEGKMTYPNEDEKEKRKKLEKQQLP